MSTNTTLKTKAMSILLAAALLFGMLPMTAFAAEITPGEPQLTTDKYDLDGDNQMDEVYEISTAAELYWFAETVNGGNTDINAVLTADIVVNTGVLREDGALNGDGKDFAPWTPIGTDANKYSGCFDGKGHTVSGLYYIEAETNCAGLFGYAQGAVIWNVGVIDSYFYGNNSVGGVLGTAHQCVISDCYNMASVGGHRYIGGIAGSLVGSQVTNCYNAGAVAGYEYVGGIFGFLSVLFTEDMSLTISDCFNVGIVAALDAATETVGSIAGSRAANEENPLLVKNCYGVGDLELFGVSTVAEQLPFLFQENCENKTAEEFADGTVLQLLNGTQEPAPWIQDAGTDSYPLLRKNHPHDYKLQQSLDGEPEWYECLCGEIAYDVYVGGVRVTESNKGDVFGDGKVSYDPQTATLTLNGWSYEGDGYEYGGNSDAERIYTAVIFSSGDLIVRSEGENTLRNTFTDEDARQYGDGIVAQNSLTLIGDGKLTIFGAFGLSSDGDVIVDDTTLEMTAQDGIISHNAILQNGAVVTITAEDEGIVADNGGNAILKDGAVVTIVSEDAGIVADEGNVIVESGASLVIRAVYDGIYARQNVSIADSVVEIETEEYGIYAYDGSVTIGSTEVSPSADGSQLDGTRVSIRTDQLAIFAFDGLTVDEKLVISSPVGGQIGEYLVENEEYGNFTYETILVGEERVKNVVIEPLGYTVTINGYGMEMLVPAGQSLNEAYCERYGVKDFSEMLNTQKAGYTFGGWYTDWSCTPWNTFDFDDSVNADLTIYAKWVAVSTGGNTPSNPPSTGDDTPADTPQGGDDKPAGNNPADNTPTVNPPTGDSGNAPLWIALLFLGSGILLLTGLDRKRNNVA